MFALIKFQARVWIKSPSSLFSFIIPTLFLLIMAPLQPNNLTGVLANVITINMISSGLMAFGFTMFEYRKSIIMKRIGSTSISKPMALLGFFSWNAFLAFVSIVWIFILGIILGASNYYNSTINFSHITWEAFIYGAFIGIILSLSIGFFFVSISKNIEIFNMYTTLYFFFATFVGGLFFPTGSETGIYSWMTYVGYVIPHTYVAQFITGSFSSTTFSGVEGMIGMLYYGEQLKIVTVSGSDYSVWNLLSGYKITNAAIMGVGTLPGGTTPVILGSEIVTTVYQWKAVLNIVIPLAFIGLSFYGSMKTFKWDSH